MFDKHWCSNPQVANIIHDSWSGAEGTRNSSLLDRIGSCRKALSQWKQTSRSNAKTRIKRIKLEIEEEGAKQFPDLSKLRRWKGELADAYHEEEVYWKQKSHVNWLRDGDRNTSFFHGSVKKKRSQNKILFLLDEHGHEQYAEGSKGIIAVDYFQKLFSTLNPKNGMAILSGLSPRVSADMNRDLIKPVSREEIKKAAFSIKGGSTPGADGMTAHFFQTYWDIVVDKVISEVQ